MVEAIHTKVCTKCGRDKRFDEFHKYKNGKFGLKPACKQCNSSEAKKWRSENREKVKETKSAYRANNKGKMSEYFAARYLKKKETICATNKRWRDKNPNKVRLMIEAARISNPESHRLVQSKRRARKLNSGGTLSAGLTKRLFSLQNGLCPCCARPLGNDFHLDHIIPLALGGSNTDNNIQLLRAKCNHQKNAKHPIDFMQSRGFLL